MGVWYLYALYIYYYNNVFIKKSDIELWLLAGVILFYVGRSFEFKGEWNNYLSNFVWFTFGLFIKHLMDEYPVDFKLDISKGIYCLVMLVATFFLGNCLILESFRE